MASGCAMLLYKLPYSQYDLCKIQDQLRNVDPIIIPWPDTAFDKYDFLSYAEQHDIDKCRFYALLDLNIIINVARLVGPERPAVADEAMKNTAALLAFLAFTDTQFNTDMAFLEESYQNNITSLFSLSGKINPKLYADIALGKKDCLEDKELPNIQKHHFDQRKPKLHCNYYLHYIGVLKVIALEKFHRGTKLTKLLELIKWMWSDFIFSAPLLLFSLVFFSPKRMSRMVKNINHNNPDKVLSGAKNAAWDLVYAHYWVARAQENVGKGNLWIFCTYDRALRTIAGALLQKKLSQLEELEELVSSFWGKVIQGKL
ncbi:MAG: hypothetical protein K9K75_06385 [Deltaproteobacteria bacterium]|nr:hypothetical protein [Deltaproteobacteria bacterium]